MKFFAVIFLQLFALSYANSKILDLDASNFEEAVRSHPFIMINFHAPWCGHCKKIANDLEEAANELAESDAKALIAKIDVTASEENKELADSLSIEGYPTFVVYSQGERLADYSGSAKHRDIVDYIILKSGPTVIAISTVAELESYCSRIHPDSVFGAGVVAVALGLFIPKSKDSEEGVHGPIAPAFISAASRYDQSMFLIADSLELVTHFKLEEDSLIIFTEASIRDVAGIIPLMSNATSDSILLSILYHSIPPVMQFNSYIQPFLQSLPIQIHCLVFIPDPVSGQEAKTIVDYVDAVLNEVSIQYRGKIIFLKVNPYYLQVVSIFNIDTSYLPEVIIADMRDPYRMRKYIYDQQLFKPSSTGEEEELAEEHPAGISTAPANMKGFGLASLRNFLQQYFDNKLQYSVRSEDIPSSDPSSGSLFHSLVGSNFIEKVYDEFDGSDVFVYVYAPWCGHCKSLEPNLRELAAHFRHDAQVVFARIDGSKNEILAENVRVFGFPTIYMFPSNNKTSPVEYDSSTELPAMIDFVEKYRLQRENALITKDASKVATV